MNCENNELIVCIDRSKKPIRENSNKIYEKIFKNIKDKINNSKEISKEDIDFIESLPENKKMEIIKEYNKRTIREIEKVSALLLYTGLR
jgi:hypothetical protein